MTQHRIHHHSRTGTAVDGTVRDSGGNPQPDRLIVSQMNAAQAPVLQHDQIQAAADYLQLIRLKAVAKQFAVFAMAHFCDQGFIAGERLGEERGACSAGTRREQLDRT
jgi:hypothetical protein